MSVSVKAVVLWALPWDASRQNGRLAQSLLSAASILYLF